MILALVKETHPESRTVRYSIEKNGLFVDGTLTINEEAAHRMYNAAKRTNGNSIWEKEIVETTEVN